MEWKKTILASKIFCMLISMCSACDRHKFVSNFIKSSTFVLTFHFHSDKFTFSAELWTNNQSWGNQIRKKQVIYFKTNIFCNLKYKKLTLKIDCKLTLISTSRLYYKNMAILNDSLSWSITLESSIMILQLSIMILKNTYRTGITHNNHS